MFWEQLCLKDLSIKNEVEPDLFKSYKSKAIYEIYLFYIVYKKLGSGGFLNAFNKYVHIYVPKRIQIK